MTKATITSGKPLNTSYSADLHLLNFSSITMLLLYLCLHLCFRSLQNMAGVVAMASVIEDFEAQVFV